ncbi:hypothetical protein BU204_01760 [Actinophytocola xanthii]|uniref:Uncharacterized protein n=1 Tax=Actinophytocola xanthii TaxID=1912961 RepID=A0A1Q8CY82_9PSEU|nr:hypothetical protein BU204_01760 [Actinophytocola xanthii]
MAATVVHRALDGRRYELSGPLDLGRPCTSSVEVTVGGRRHELVAGSTGLGAEVATALGLSGFDEELRFDGGTLLVGRTRRAEPGSRITEDLLLVVWQGRRHCLIGHFYATTTATAVELLHSLGIAEHDDGLMLRPRDPASALAAPATLVKEIPTLGLLELTVPSAPQATRLPAWKGARTRSGELFSDRLSNGDPYFVLAGADTWTTVLPLAATDLERVPAVVDRLGLRLLDAR